jgi:hypothetical protein
VQYGLGNRAKKNPHTNESIAGPVNLTDEELSKNRRDLYEQSVLQPFDSDWWLEDSSTLKIIESIPTIVVSPELHKRENEKVWDRVLTLRSLGLDISVCTDFPNELASMAGIN